METKLEPPQSDVRSGQRAAVPRAAEPVPRRIRYADDDRSSVRTLALMRLPSLCAGLFLGIGLSFATSRFEDVLSRNIEVAFFIPFVVYMASAVGTQTQSIYIRDLRSGRARFRNYLVKESLLGLVLGVGFGLVSWGIVSAWFNAPPLAAAVGLSMFGVVATAPLIGLVVTELFQLERHDPAVGAGPIATVIQDVVSVVMFGSIASAIFLG